MSLHLKWAGRLIGGASFVAVCALHFSSPAAAQYSAPVPATAAVEIVGADGEVVLMPAEAQAMIASGAQPAAAPGSPAASKSEESPRHKRLKALTYDRRASAILRAWSTPETASDADDETATIADGDDASATESNEEGSVAVPSDAGAASAPVAAAAPTDEPDDSGPIVAPSATADGQSKPQIDPKVLNAEIKALQRNVTLGNWSEVKAYFAGLPEKEAADGYAQMVRSLASPPQAQGADPRMARMSFPGVGMLAETNQFTLQDVIDLVAVCPHERKRETIQRIVPILKLAMDRGVMEQSLLDLLTAQAESQDGSAVLSRAECAWLLLESGRVEELEPFLPTFEEALAKNDAESLILLARCQLAQYEAEKKPETLETCWNILQPACSIDEATREQREQAVKLLLGLVPRVREDLGMAWMEEKLTDDPEFAMRVLASTGASASTGFQTSPTAASARLTDLKLQKTVVESLLEKTHDRATEWKSLVRMLASSWLREAEFSRTADRTASMGPRLRRDTFGNLYYLNMNEEMSGGAFQPNDGRQPQPIPTADVLKTAPNETWLAVIDDAIRPRFIAIEAQLYLNAGEEELAFPLIERLAPAHADLAKDLVHEFINAWTRNHDPNSSRTYTSPYMYMYGFDVKANGIPLTRSKQQRNIEELTGWVRRIRQLEIEDLDEALLARAFTNCHSSAEVYRLEDIEVVFGAIGDLEPETLAQLVQQMRGNLASVWRAPANQEAAKTQRKQQDIQAEVLRGYDVARRVVDDGLGRHAGDWRLQLAQSCLLLDEAMFANEVAPSSEFSQKRLAALDEFRKAAESYAATVATLKEEEQESAVYEHWFYAGLGASDLNLIDHRATADARQPALIRQALLALPGEAAESHLGKFANSLFTRMSGLNPAVKFQYLKAGFEIVGDHDKALEARKVYDYYNDLVTEIKLVARLDGSGRVGHDDPFGVFVEIHHTREIERESGGFAKYLQNQQNAMYSYNYGRPLNNYRDKFEEGVRAALQENFQVLSVTFYDEKDVRSRALETYGWRSTPYAYVLLKPNGPQIDKLPSLKIDLDFLDTSGYVVLPVATAALPIDAAPEQADSRPYEKLSITQILDERESASRKLKLEIKAVGRGLVPKLDQVVDLRTSDFEATATLDQGVLVSRFDTDSGEPSIISERTWIVDYAGRQDLAALPTVFHFPKPKIEPAEIAYLRYEDADLKPVESTVSLVHEYGDVRRTWPWVVAIAVILLAALAIAARSLLKQRANAGDARPELPEKLTPFAALSLLRDIEQANGFDHETRRELASSIQSIERHYFAENGEGNGHEPNLRSLAEDWLTRSSRFTDRRS